MQLAECLSERVRGGMWEHWCGSVLRWWRAAAEGNADWRLLCLLPYGLLIALLRTRAHSYAQPAPFQVEVTRKNTHHLTDVLHPDISKQFVHLRYRPFYPEGTSTEQLLKKFTKNSIKNNANEQRSWLNWKRAHLSQVLCVINDMGVFVYTSELSVNKWSSGVCGWFWGWWGQEVRVRPAAGLCPLIPLFLCNCKADLPTGSPFSLPFVEQHCRLVCQWWIVS